jgi:hypothetical protein
MAHTWQVRVVVVRVHVVVGWGGGGEVVGRGHYYA